MDCIIDFSGNIMPGSWPAYFRADWDGEKVIFSGDGDGVPDMPAPEEPTESEVWQWAEDHDWMLEWSE